MGLEITTNVRKRFMADDTVKKNSCHSFTGEAGLELGMNVNSVQDSLRALWEYPGGDRYIGLGHCKEI